MRRNRLKLVVPENGDDARPTARRRSGRGGETRIPRTPRLRLVDADEGAPPDDAA